MGCSCTKFPSNVSGNYLGWKTQVQIFHLSTPNYVPFNPAYLFSQQGHSIEISAEFLLTIFSTSFKALKKEKKKRGRMPGTEFISVMWPPIERFLPFQEANLDSNTLIIGFHVSYLQGFAPIGIIFKPETILKLRRITFRAQELSCDASPMARESSAYCNIEKRMSWLHERPLNIRKRKGDWGSPCMPQKMLLLPGVALH